MGTHFIVATMAVVPEPELRLSVFSVIAGYFLGLKVRYTEEQIKTEKISTTKYMPTQKRNGCREPNTSCLLVFFIAIEIKFFEKDNGYSLTKLKHEKL